MANRTMVSILDDYNREPDVAPLSFPVFPHIALILACAQSWPDWEVKPRDDVTDCQMASVDFLVSNSTESLQPRSVQIMVR